MRELSVRRRLAIVASSAILLMLGAQKPGDVPSALESAPAGWSDLLAPSGAGLDAWTREPIPAGGDLVEDSPWKLDASTGVLTASAPGADREWLRLDQVLLDFIVHVEWRIVPDPAAKSTGGGVYFRNSNDAGMWHKAQIGDAKGGYLVGSTFAGFTAKPFNLEAEVKDQRVKPAGEWNTFELTCKGRSVALWVNGAVANEWKGCGVPRGYIGLEVEGGRVEFRNLKLKAL
ncbi:DUF1080 domain-containing protein [Planctomyces sp. SH-PL62]|uniref:3-keto-disaccharide hydrolase n=1 Tax=Planctomyces sp. SH-PL62 TaxID=1636152 RepID=UPI00078C16F0|nr:DUF1080 domain-containing protein [Planctomyces sp. SH-PL62]AMV39678.1 hypothetical protein VT85_19755 [Planctomyces sp. SH-PL62]